jgi:fused signal recognition particle receptor
MGIFDKIKDRVRSSRLREGLSRTRQRLAENVHQALTGRSRVDEEALEELEEILLSADVGVAATERLLDRLRERIRSEGIESGEVLEDALAEEVTTILAGAEAAEPRLDKKPWVVLLVGVNGTGKTTTLGKLAYHHKEAGRKVLVGAADTFRAAAVDQLRIWADRAGVDVVANESGADPAAVAYDAADAALARGTDIVLVDTAGRLQTKVNLMEELRKIDRVVAKRIPDAPHEVLLVLDATTGQNAIQQAKQFGEVTNLTGIVLTKVDGTAKGGVVIAIAEQLGIPVRYLGLGEKMEDLAPFEAETFAAAIFARE